MFLLCYRHHCDDFWSLINFLHWSLSLKQYFKFSQSSNYFDINTNHAWELFQMRNFCPLLYHCWDVFHMTWSVSLTGNWGQGDTQQRCQTQLYLGIWAPESVILWLIFIVSSILTQIPASWWSPCLTGHTHLKQQLRLGSALITNTKEGTETTGMIRNTKYVNSKPAPQIPRTIRLDFLGFLYIKSHVRLINCPLTSGSFR